MHYVRAFGRFWYDFLVGDRWELFVGPIVALLGAWALLQASVASGVTGLVLFILVAAVGALSVGLALRA